jgi:hypothetical protein
MSTPIVWNISPSVPTPGSTIKINFTSLPPSIEFYINIVLPSGGIYKLLVTGMIDGTATEYVVLDSGIGIYVLTPQIPGELLPTLNVTVQAADTIVPSIISNIKITGEPVLLVGTEINLQISGLRPAVLTNITYTTSDNTSTIDSIISGIDGTITVARSLFIPDRYTILASDGYGTSQPFYLDIVESINIPGVIIGGELSCDNSLVLTSVFDRQEYRPGSSGVLSVSICSRGLAPSNIVVNPPLLPTNITFTVPPLIGAIVLPVANGTTNTCVEFAFPFTVSIAGNMVVDYSGTYRCDGDEYKINASSALALATAGIDIVCSAGVFALASIFPIGFESEQWGSLQVNIVNTGTQIITGINLSPVALPGPLSTSDVVRITDITLLPGARGDFNFTIRGRGNIIIPGNPPPANITSTIMIPAGSITGICGGNTIQINEENLFATYTILPRPAAIS